MSDAIHCNDGCDLSPEEVLARLQIGLKSDEELHPDFPDEGTQTLREKEAVELPSNRTER